MTVHPKPDAPVITGQTICENETINDITPNGDAGSLFTITGTGVTFNDGTKFASTPTRGVHAGIRYVFSTTTDVSGTPGNGNIRFNNGTFGSITTITVAGTNADEQDFELFLDFIVFLFF